MRSDFPLTNRMLRQALRWARVAVPAAIVLQLGSCFGGDPRFFVASTVSEAVTSAVFASLVSAFVNAATGQS